MQDTEIYEEFIEGKLSADSEQKLMARLTFDNELRTNFKHHLLVTSSIRNFVENEAISDNVTNKVFTSLGFSPIINSVPIPNKPKQSFFKSKFFTATMSSMITLIIVFLYLDFFGVKNNGRNEIERNYTVQSPFYDYIYNFNKPSNEIYNRSISEDFWTSNPGYRTTYNDGILGAPVTDAAGVTHITGQEIFLKNNFGTAVEFKQVTSFNISSTFESGNYYSMVYEFKKYSFPFSMNTYAHQVHIEEILMWTDGSFRLIVSDPNVEGLRTIGYREFLSFPRTQGFMLGK
jgi:hypothetical protein